MSRNVIHVGSFKIALLFCATNTHTKIPNMETSLFMKEQKTTWREDANSN